MTSLVGVLCSNGVVLGADSAATFSAGRLNTIEQPMKKLNVVAEQVVVAGSGDVGLDQRFRAVLKKAYSDKAFQNSPIDVVKNLCRKTIDDFTETYVKMGKYGALLAFACENRPCLCEFSIEDFQPELKTDQLWYCSMGSAQTITDPFLGFMRGVFWEKGPPRIQEAVFAVTWCLELAIELNPGGVNGPVRIAVLERNDRGHLSARILSEDELGEHQQNVVEVVRHLREFPKLHQPEAGEIPSEMLKR